METCAEHGTEWHWDCEGCRARIPDIHAPDAVERSETSDDSSQSAGEPGGGGRNGSHRARKERVPVGFSSEFSENLLASGYLGGEGDSGDVRAWVVGIRDGVEVGEGGVGGLGKVWWVAEHAVVVMLGGMLVLGLLFGAVVVWVEW